MKINKNNKWYSTIIALLTMWLMMSFTMWVFTMITRQLKDIKSLEMYNKAYLWAESGIELWLLTNKVNDYSTEVNYIPINNELWYWNTIFNECFYDINSSTNSLSWTIIDFKVVPLFVAMNGMMWNYEKLNTSNLKLDLSSQNIAWNILSETSWLFWKWNIYENSKWTSKLNNNWATVYNENISISDYLSSNSNNFLILQNLENNDIDFELTWIWNQNLFTKDNISITSECRINWYKQKIKVAINTAEIYEILKYSIYSN